MQELNISRDIVVFLVQFELIFYMFVISFVQGQIV